MMIMYFQWLCCLLWWPTQTADDVLGRGGALWRCAAAAHRPLQLDTLPPRLRVSKVLSCVCIQNLAVACCKGWFPAVDC
jgi:hypothetical protein